jgi:predicted nucleotidyltransferase
MILCMEMPTEQIITQMCEEIVRAEDPWRIVLIGSCAEGVPGPESDVDLLVVTRVDFGKDYSRRRVASSIRRALSRFRVAKDILIYSPEELEKWKDSKNHILYAGLRKGRVLYARLESRATDDFDGAQGSIGP